MWKSSTEKEKYFYHDVFSHCIWAVEGTASLSLYTSATVWREHTVTVFLFGWTPKDYWQPSRVTPQDPSFLHQHKRSQRTCFPMWHWHLAPKLFCSLPWKSASNYTVWLSWLTKSTIILVVTSGEKWNAKALSGQPVKKQRGPALNPESCWLLAGKFLCSQCKGESLTISLVLCENSYF